MTLINGLAISVVVLVQLVGYGGKNRDSIRMIRAEYSLTEMKAVLHQLQSIAETALALPGEGEVVYAGQRRGMLLSQHPLSRLHYLHFHRLGLLHRLWFQYVNARLFILVSVNDSTVLAGLSGVQSRIVA